MTSRQEGCGLKRRRGGDENTVAASSPAGTPDGILIAFYNWCGNSDYYIRIEITVNQTDHNLKKQQTFLLIAFKADSW